MDPTFLLAGCGKDMTSFFSMTFLFLFFPACLLVYSIVPKSWKKYFLLFASYLFYWFVSGTLVVYLILSTLSVFLLGIWIDRIQMQMKEHIKELPKEERKIAKQKFIHRQQRVVFLGVLLHIGFLLVVKYSGFFVGNINLLLSLSKSTVVLDIPQFAMPIGISFFTLQAVSYIIDVYHGLVKCDRSFFRLALFMSFFPQIVEGPICRYSQTAEQLWQAGPIKYNDLTLGLQRMLYGMMKKIVIADRLNPLVTGIFDKSNSYGGVIILLGAVCYTIQLYMDFSGVMDAVAGIGQIFGLTMPENFERPFFSRSISEFWKRWHISLGAWFRDYIFYPVTSTKRMKQLTSSARKKLGNHFGPLVAGGIALFCVWFCNGLWHGAAWSFIFFGMYHFTLILLESMTAPAAAAFNARLHINTDGKPYRFMQIIRTTILVVIGELFFRANGFMAGLSLFRRIFTSLSINELSLQTFHKLGIDGHDILIVGITVIIVFIVSLINEKGISIRETLAKKNIVVRWGVLYALIFYIIIFGAYGFGYLPVDPMYAQF